MVKYILISYQEWCHETKSNAFWDELYYDYGHIITKDTFKHCIYKINEVVYTEWTPEFEQALAWEILKNTVVHKPE